MGGTSKYVRIAVSACVLIILLRIAAGTVLDAVQPFFTPAIGIVGTCLVFYILLRVFRGR